MRIALISAAATALLCDAALALHLPALFGSPQQPPQQPRCSLYSGFKDSPSLTSLCKQLPRATRSVVTLDPPSAYSANPSASTFVPSISTEHFTFDGGKASTISPINPAALFSAIIANNPGVPQNLTGLPAPSSSQPAVLPAPTDIEVNCYLDKSKVPMSECTRTAALTRHHGYTYTPSLTVSASSTSSMALAAPSQSLSFEKASTSSKMSSISKPSSSSKAYSSITSGTSSMPVSSSIVTSSGASTTSAPGTATGTAPHMPPLPTCWLQCFQAYNASRPALCGNHKVNGCIGAVCPSKDAADYYVWLKRFCPATPISSGSATPSSRLPTVSSAPMNATTSMVGTDPAVSGPSTSTNCTRTMGLTRHHGYTYPDTLSLQPLPTSSTLNPSSSAALTSSSSAKATDSSTAPPSECIPSSTVIAAGSTLRTSFVHSYDCNNITAAEPHRMRSSTSAKPSLITTTKYATSPSTSSIPAQTTPFRPVAPEAKFQEYSTTTVVDATVTTVVPCPTHVQRAPQERKRDAWFMQAPPSAKLCDAGVYCVNSTFVSDAPPSWHWDAVELQQGQTCLEDNVFNTAWVEQQCACAGL